MGLLRLLIWGLLFYLGYKLFTNLFTSVSGAGEKDKVHGQKKGNPPLNLNDQDIEDADFKEIK